MTEIVCLEYEVKRGEGENFGLKIAGGIDQGGVRAVSTFCTSLQYIGFFVASLV